MNLDVNLEVADFVNIIILTFIIVEKNRNKKREVMAGTGATEGAMAEEMTEDLKYE